MTEKELISYMPAVVTFILMFQCWLMYEVSLSCYLKILKEQITLKKQKLDGWPNRDN